MPAANLKRFMMPVMLFLWAATVVIFCLTLEVSLPVIACLTLLILVAVAVRLSRPDQRWHASLAGAATIGVIACMWAGKNSVFMYGWFAVAVAAGNAMALGFTGACMRDEEKLLPYWRLLVATWAFLAMFLWLCVAYLTNSVGPFYIGLIVGVALLVATKLRWDLPPVMVLAANTALLFLIGLPLADWLTQPNFKFTDEPDPGKRLYSYEVARQNPAEYAYWWYYFVKELDSFRQTIYMPATNRLATFQLRPDSEVHLFKSLIHINHLGYRGREFSTEKADAYRIVALGESTTFGITISENDLPWPELLERMIRQRLNLRRPVQVINAGIPSYTLKQNLERLRLGILDLKPDMIISYHGFNGFNWLKPELPDVSTKKMPPPYVPRPLTLLGNAEYGIKLRYYRKSMSHPATPAKTAAGSLEDNEYMRSYRELIQIARTNQIRLVLANYSMAVNARSKLDVIVFYRATWPSVLVQMKANEMHSQIVARLAAECPDVCFVDTLPVFDGQYDKFIDLVHFTESGEQIMAETMFAAIRPQLEKELGK